MVADSRGRNRGLDDERVPALRHHRHRHRYRRRERRRRHRHRRQRQRPARVAAYHAERKAHSAVPSGYGGDHSVLWRRVALYFHRRRARLYDEPLYLRYARSGPVLQDGGGRERQLSVARGGRRASGVRHSVGRDRHLQLEGERRGAEQQRHFARAQRLHRQAHHPDGHGHRRILRLQAVHHRPGGFQPPGDRGIAQSVAALRGGYPVRRAQALLGHGQLQLARGRH